MPGIFGAHNTSPGFNVHKNLRAMAQTMCVNERLCQDSFFVDGNLCASRVHLGNIGMKNTPHIDNGIHVWIEGETYNLQEVCKKEELNYNKYIVGNSTAQTIAEAYLSGKLDTLLASIDGYFCAVLYDSKKQKLLLISDRYGMRLLYWYLDGDCFAWASEVKGVLALDGVDKTIDPTSPSCFLKLGHLMGEHTWFKKVKLIKPASVLEYDLHSKKLTHRYYWKWSEIKPSKITFNQAVEALGEIFLEAVARRVNPNERIGISLSGGLDSRVIFAAVNQLYPGYEGYAYTFGLPECDDITIAQQVIAKVPNWKHQAFYFDSNNWFDPRMDRIWNTDGMFDMMHMHGSEFLPEVSNHVNINLNGYLGDAVVGASYFRGGGFSDTRISNQVAKNYYKDFFGENSLNNDFYNNNHIDPYLYMNRGRRFINYGTLNGLSQLDQRIPFFDNNIIELIFSIPDEYRMHNRLYTEFVIKFFPDFFNDIPWQKTGRRVGLTGPVSFPQKIVKKISHIPCKLGITKSKKEYTNYPTWIRDDGVQTRIKDLLNDKKSYSTELLGEDPIKRYLTPHLAKRANYSNEILRIVTMEVYFKRVFAKWNNWNNWE